MARNGGRDGRSSRLRQRRRSRSDSSSSSGERSDASNDSDSGRRSRSRRHGEHMDDVGLSFEHIEAIRGVKIIPRVEYPLPHLPREKLFKHDDADAECFCTFPAESEPDKNRCEDVSCLNYATYIECSPAHCDAGMYCCNQRLQHPERFPQLEPFKTDSKGYGVRAREEIAQSTVIGEYVGEIIDEKELQRRMKTAPRHDFNFYYLALQPGVYIDARNKGSFTRFMNHSCEPNCKTEKWTVKGEMRIAVVSMRNISAQEELTFDYQWKSLGSQQIKCYCGATTCRGVIGAEVDATKTIVDTGSVQGFYREPTREEIGDVLVGRHIRLFLTASDTSIYAIATVRAFNAGEDTYEVEYVESVGTPEDSLSFDSPLSAIEELRNQPFVKLSERSWQIYVELGGMSNDQIEKAVFSIPKRRAAESSTASDSPGKTDSQATATTASASPSSTTPSPTPIPAPPVYMEQRDHDGELLDIDGEIVTTKLLIKGLPPKCTESLLRRMFSAPRQSQSASMLQRLQSSIMAQRSTTDAVLLKLDLFFFDDSSGWALIEFADPSFAKLFRKNLNARDLLGQQLRVFLAGKKEVENFERAKRNTTLRRGDTNGREGKSEASIEESSAGVPHQQPPVVYPFGRALDWLVNIEKVEDSPSRRKGMSQASEERMRALYVQLVLQVTRHLRLESEYASSTVLSLHRMFTFRPMNNLDTEIMAAGMLHIFLKARSRRFSWPEYVVEVYSAKYSKSKLQVDSEVYKRFERQILETEMELLDSVLYDLSCEDPYAILETMTSSRKKPDTASSTSVPTAIHKHAKHLISVVFPLTVWAHASVECVTLSILYVAAAVSTALTFSGRDLEFSPSNIPEYLPFLDPFASEKDALALLECSVLIADGLKERWVRDEKLMLARRLAARQTDPDFFDTEQFAVQRHKPVEISIRISTLLKAWIGVSSPDMQSKQQYGARAPLRSLSELKLRQMQGSLNEQFTVVTPETWSVKVSGVLQRMPVPAKAGVDLYRRARRLRVKDLEQVQQIRKRSYIGSITASLDGIYDVAGKPVYVQPWPYQQLEPVFRNSNGSISRACVRELSTAMLMTSRAPHRFLRLVGVVFPDEEKVEDASSTPDFSLDLHDHTQKTQLEPSDYYLAFEQPLHSYAGLLEAKTNVPMALRKKAIFDMLQAIAMCHEWNLVHRYVASCHLFVMRDGIRLGGYQAMREMSVKSETSGRQYELNDIERKEHCHGTWLQVSPPEVLLGGRHFTTRGDIWAAGCVALDILFDRIPFLHAPDVKAQLNLIYRLCGTPHTMWKDGTKLLNYGMFKPKRETNMRVRKTLLENRQEKRLDVPTEAIDLLEAMLQLDPSKRMSAKRLLEMPYFAECREAAVPLDFSHFPSTFEMQSRRFQSGVSSSSSSKRRREQERPGSASSAESVGSKLKRESSSRRSSGISSVSDDVEMEGEMDADNLVPLPDMLRDVVKDEGEGGQGEKPIATQKRVKLDWGMGLNTHS